MPPKKPFAGSLSRQLGQGAPSYAAASDHPAHGTTGGGIRYRVDELLKGGREATLIHRGEEYRLRITSTGKLILTK